MDERTPVIVGVGQSSERVDDASYLGMSPVELAASACRAALADCGVDSATVARVVDTVAAVRQFETSSSLLTAPLGSSNNYPRSVCQRIDANPKRAILESVGGHGPQRLVTELGSEISAGKCDVAMIFGSDAVSTQRYFARRDDKPEFSEEVEGQLEDRGYGYDYYIDDYTVSHGLFDPPASYGVLDNARRARLGVGVGEYRHQMGVLLAPFSTVAAKNPFSAAPKEYSATELATVTAENRMICDPYPRRMVARDQTNQGAAVLIMSVATARRLGISDDKFVFLHGHSDLVDLPVLERTEFGAGRACVEAAEVALGVAGIGVDELGTLDLYSCFPIAVSSLCDGLELSPQDPRGLTVTGGLPFFGGPGNAYSIHAIAETVARLRTMPGAYGLVGANGGVCSKYSVGIYSTQEAPWRIGDDQTAQQRLLEGPRVQVSTRPAGAATIETYTVRYDWPVRTGIVVGRLVGGERERFLATTTDETLVALMSESDPIGRVDHRGSR